MENIRREKNTRVKDILISGNFRPEDLQYLVIVNEMSGRNTECLRRLDMSDIIDVSKKRRNT